MPKTVKLIPGKFTCLDCGAIKDTNEEMEHHRHIAHPPMRIIEYFPDGQEKRLASTPEGLHWLEMYVKRKLLESKVIPDYEANPEDPQSIASRIVYDAWRQPNPIYFANLGIERAIKFPPDPINKRHFSLKAFTERDK